jgi:hypothetical protein
MKVGIQNTGLFDSSFPRMQKDQLQIAYRDNGALMIVLAKNALEMPRINSKLAFGRTRTSTRLDADVTGI